VQIATTPHDTVLVLTLSGSVDSLSADELTQGFAQALAQGHARQVADFARVTYTSSAGLRSLLGAVKSCRLAGGDLRLAAPQPQVQRVLEVAGFVSILQIFPDARQAVASFGAVAP
jgi:anti-sigma B factor antagonist